MRLGDSRALGGHLNFSPVPQRGLGGPPKAGVSSSGPQTPLGDGCAQ